MRVLKVLSILLLSFIVFAALKQEPGKVYRPSGGDGILTPVAGPEPGINGPLVYGCRPGNPFLYRIPCQGTRPIKFSVKGLPSGLILDSSTGIIKGTAPAGGEYKLSIEAVNASGKDRKSFTIKSGSTLALTPPMGWNHWYAHHNNVTDKMMRTAADLLISSGMADVGYDYVNIDDCWMNATEHWDPLRIGPFRDERGNILPNKHFPDMKAMTDYIHNKGLKAGIYSSPGPLTCAKFAGSYQHEEQDAEQYARWGFDFLKYDFCSWVNVAGDGTRAGREKISLENHKLPFRMMGDILKRQKRDIVYNLCQYGMADVWKWGAEVGAQCWRTGDDLGYVLDKIFDVALINAEHREFSKPGEWNDPDYIQIGWIGLRGKRDKPELVQIPMAPTKQYAYMSLWSLMASPLVYSGDMSKLDAFTLNILCNSEVIEVNQDPLGESGLVIKRNDLQFLMIKKQIDGTKAVGLFNRSKEPVNVKINFSEMQMEGKQPVRDLWRQKDLGKYMDSFEAEVPGEGVVMVKIGK